MAVAHGFVRCRKQHQAACGGHSAAGLSARSASRLQWQPVIATGTSRGLWQLHMDLCAVENSSERVPGQPANCRETGIAIGPSRGLWQWHMELCAVGNSSGQCAGCTGHVSQQIAVCALSEIAAGSAPGALAMSASRLQWRPATLTGTSRGLRQLHMDLCVSETAEARQQEGSTTD